MSVEASTFTENRFSVSSLTTTEKGPIRFTDRQLIIRSVERLSDLHVDFFKKKVLD
jgi:hypothetical protein